MYISICVRTSYNKNQEKKNIFLNWECSRKLVARMELKNHDLYFTSLYPQTYGTYFKYLTKPFLRIGHAGTDSCESFQTSLEKIVQSKTCVERKKKLVCVLCFCVFFVSKYDDQSFNITDAFLIQSNHMHHMFI